jgi:hypothetical protein
VEESEIGTEEKGFVHQYIATGNLEVAARGSGLVPVDASSAVAKRTAMQALGDSTVKAYFIDLMDEVGLTPQAMMRALLEGLTTEKFGINQKTGEVVSLGADGMTRMTAVKLIGTGMGIYGGGVKQEPSDQRNAPTTVNIIFPERNIHDSAPREPQYIDGDDDYTVTED